MLRAEPTNAVLYSTRYAQVAVSLLQAYVLPCSHRHLTVTLRSHRLVWLDDNMTASSCQQAWCKLFQQLVASLKILSCIKFNFQSDLMQLAQNSSNNCKSVNELFWCIYFLFLGVFFLHKYLKKNTVCNSIIDKGNFIPTAVNLISSTNSSRHLSVILMQVIVNILQPNLVSLFLFYIFTFPVRGNFFSFCGASWKTKKKHTYYGQSRSVPILRE